MKYIICSEPGHFRMEEKEEPTINDHEALLQINTIGICGTDLHAYTGNQPFFKYPRIMGHELGAQVLQIGGQVTNVKPGDKVVVMPYLSCGQCIACRKGKTNCCSSIQVLGVHMDGGMQERIAVRSDILVPVNDLTFQDIAIIEPLAIGAHAVRRASLSAGEIVLVIGCGPIGLGIMKLAKEQGVKVIAMDVIDQRLEFAKEIMDIDFIVNARENPLQTIIEITQGDLATCVFDATGNKFALESGPKFMAYGGRFVLVGLSKGDLTFHHPAIHAKEASLLCSRNATFHDFHSVINLLNRGAFPTENYISHRVPFDDMIAHFDRWVGPESGVIKAVVEV